MERRGTKDLGEQIQTDVYVVGKIVESRVKCAGHVSELKRREIA